MAGAMRVDFIVTTFDIAPYLGACLDSLRAVVRPGDAVIVVDDGSTDGTAEAVEAALAGPGWPEDGNGPGVRRQAILIGANTPGGVGIPANIGLMHAGGEAVFFVDGDDWLDPAGFRAARAAFERANAGGARADILIANYREHDEATGRDRAPADARRWIEVPRATGAAARRRLALSLIAVPWRKFYRRDFLVRHGLRFPEGRFFYEDNPFHWAVCLAAGTIAFADVTVCRHRINRPGQTMAATGVELTAFFDHYDTIRAMIRSGLPPGDAALEGAALDWLLAQMSWHVGRLAPAAWWPYAARAAAALAAPDAAVWAGAMARAKGTQVAGIAAALRAGDIAGVVGVWTAERAQRKLEAVDDAIRRLAGDVAALRAKADATQGTVEALARIAEFDALAALLPPDPDPDLPGAALP
jgi:glycosyltransferase involved in cell wall biosynthesis